MKTDLLVLVASVVGILLPASVTQAQGWKPERNVELKSVMGFLGLTK